MHVVKLDQLTPRLEPAGSKYSLQANHRSAFYGRPDVVPGASPFWAYDLSSRALPNLRQVR